MVVYVNGYMCWLRCGMNLNELVIDLLISSLTGNAFKIDPFVKRYVVAGYSLRDVEGLLVDCSLTP